ncbi:MAG: DUF2726 domain-containing protein [Candidatus Woesebacteria bacterium]|nr:DUF2726 domain-containing protein [Candidatus Woesebacteria bacterium]
MFNLESLSVPLMFLILFIVGILFYVFLSKLKVKSKRIYKEKGPYLLNAGEKAFFDTLITSITINMYICPKVRIADLVEVDSTGKDKKFWTYFNKISQKHVDFVICNKTNFSPLLIVELDGGSHNEYSKLLRDKLVDSVFKDANIPILHVKTSNFYNYQNLRDQINISISKTLKGAG